MITPEQEEHLLRRFEPVLRFTKGETFFPMDVEPYVRASSLWVQYPGSEPALLVAQDQFSLETLAAQRMDGFQATYFLRFIEPLDVINLVTFLRERTKNLDPQDIFRINFGRLARVGYSSRFADLLFSLSLLLRGRVPGDTSAAAALEYRKLLRDGLRFRYHGRVVQQGDWIVLQYWYFYAFNNWRSGFFGVNDHEADWEQVNIYLYQDASGEYHPEWVAFSMHDYSGDDLRRRWDDPELTLEGEHVVVYVGAGSHACYYAPGEYLAELEFPFLFPVARFFRRFNRIWRRLTGLVGEGQVQFEEQVNFFRVPFVDYARGDGLSIGEGGKTNWEEPHLLSPTPDWVQNYRGLWGLYAQDPVAGEDAPAGPMYNRDGSLRRSWYDPAGWAGLDRVPPPNRALAVVQREQDALQIKQEALEVEIDVKSYTLEGVGILDSAVTNQAHFAAIDQDNKLKLHTLSEEVAHLREQYSVNEKRLDALENYRQRLQTGEKDPVRAHIRRPHQPASSSELHSNKLAEFWAAISIGLLMIGFVLLALFFRQHLVLGLVVLISAFAFIESGFHRRLPQVINSLAIGLAVVSALVIIFHFFWPIVILVVVLAGVYVMWENIQELAHR